jgi:hypothetical protein
MGWELDWTLTPRAPFGAPLKQYYCIAGYGCPPIPAAIRLINGTWAYSVRAPAGFTAVSGGGTVTVDGAAVALNVTFELSPTHYLATFAAEGLPPVNEWRVLVFWLDNGSPCWSAVGHVSNDSSPPSGPLIDGLYGFSIDAPNQSLDVSPTPEAGSFVVDGANVTIDIQFVPGYEVWFSALNLPPDASWSISIDGGPPTTSNSSTILVPELNGTYAYSVAVSDPRFTAAPGSFLVGGRQLTVDVNLTEVEFSLAFSEIGIPPAALARAGWIVELGGVTQRSGIPTMGFVAPTGTYSILITGPSGFQSSVPPGTFTVASNSSAEVSFHRAPTVTLTFAAHGLVHQQPWCVRVNQEGWCTILSTLKYEGLPPGSYSYGALRPTVGQTISARIGSTTLPPVGNLTLSRSERVDLRFEYSVPVTFDESGLRGGNWSVTVHGVRLAGAAGTPLVVSLANGTYRITVHSVKGYVFATATTKIWVVGRPVSVLITFGPIARPSATMQHIAAAAPPAVIAARRTFAAEGVPGFVRRP